MSEISADARHAIQQARQALQNGDKKSARHYAQLAASLAPDWEDPWLWLAASASPRASLGYLRKALDINPASQRARQGIHWALERQRKLVALESPEQPHSPPVRITKSWLSQPVLLITLLVCLAGLIWFVNPHLSFANPLGFLSVEAKHEVALVLPAWLAPTIVPSATATSTATTTPTATATATSTATSTATATITPTSTQTPVPTDTPLPPTPQPPADRDIDQLPYGVRADERWIDVDLSRQMVFAYNGYQLVNQFVVSTGTWQYPTVTGTFSIYVMYRYADMAGPGYYLPDVPYVMYFYKGYGLHGTYWHDNFGTPMSHGCVNLRTEDAKWVFGWANVGTIVHVHY